MTRTTGREVIPSAKRLIKSLRDMGYDFETAVADIIDNSIEAGATQVKINIEFAGDDSWVRIVDNGLGMNLSGLQEAMRYGSEREYDGEEDLGKFGLGLKTASLSQCQKLTVASRNNKQQKEIHAFSWDLSHIDQTDKWEIIKPDRKSLKLVLDRNLETTTGTVVFWQRLDRIQGYRHPYGEMARKRLSAMCRELEEHLAMVFHRFLAGEVPGKKLQIILNENQIEPWDPFARNEKRTLELERIPVHLEFEGKAGIVTLEPYVLPHQDDFSSKDAFAKASGPRKWNNQQGFYIYRANRLIQSGGWSGLRIIDEHSKLARVALSFSPYLDDAFKINVSKMRVQLPGQIKDQIEEAIKPVTKIAQETYRKSGQKSSETPQFPLTTPIPTNQQIAALPPQKNPSESNLEFGDTKTIISTPQPIGLSFYTQQTKQWTLDEIQIGLENSADPSEKPIISNVFNRFRISLNKGEGKK